MQRNIINGYKPFRKRKPYCFYFTLIMVISCICVVIEGFCIMASSNGNTSALLAFCAGNSLVTAEFPAQRPVTWRFDALFDLRLNQQLCKQWRRRWFETASRSLWRHCNASHLLLCGQQYVTDTTDFRFITIEYYTILNTILKRKDTTKYRESTVYWYHSHELLLDKGSFSNRKDVGLISVPRSR